LKKSFLTTKRTKTTFAANFAKAS